MVSSHNRWMSVAGGVLLGLIASAAPSEHLFAAGTQARAANAVKEADGATLAGTQRSLRLAGGQRLQLSTNGAELTLQGPGGTSAARTWSLPEVRRNASLTMLPDGRVLIWGGHDARGTLQRDGVWFDPDLRTVEPALRLPMSPRSGHTATVLTDGRVLFAGGRGEHRGQELWHPASAKWTQIDAATLDAGHRAVLRADGQVHLSTGNGAAVVTRADLLFDPDVDRFTPRDARQATPSVAEGLAGSLPEQGSTNVTVDATLALRFSDQVRLDDLNTATVTLFGPGGATQVRVTTAEAGRLAFVHPNRQLFPDAPYTLMVKGVGTQKGKALPLMTVDFRTAALASPQTASTAAANSTAAAADPVYCEERFRTLRLCQGKGQMQDGMWTPGQDNAGENWRVAGRQPELAYLGLMPDIFKAWGRNALTGTVLRADGAPVAGVAVSVGKLSALTNRAGQFLLYDVPQGRQRLYVDGTTANAPGEEYGQFVVGVDVEANGLSQVPFTMWLPRIAARDKIQIPSPSTQELVLKHPDLPGMELRIPAGTVIRDQKGKIVTEVAIVPTPVNRSPYPLPTNFPMYFTLQPGGAVLQGLTPEAGKGARVIYPNYDRHPEGTRADFWLYDAMEGWRVYGQGRVNREETQFIPEPGVALHEVVTFGAAVSPNDPAPEEDMPPDDQECGECNAGTGENATAGDPIDLKTGRFSYAETDISIRDVIPLTLGRNYRPSDLVKREFGLGTAAGFMYRLAVKNTYATMQLVLPNGTPLVFNQTSGSGAYGTWKHSGRHAFAGATLVSESSGGWKYRLTMRDGSQMTFEQYSPNRIKTWQDRFGNVVEYQYDAGNVSRILSPNGRYIDLNYDTQNRIISAVDPIGSTWRYEYNTRGMLAKVIFPDNTSRRYEYRTYSTPEVGTTAPLVWNLLNAIYDQRGNRVLFNEYDGPPYGLPGGIGTSGRVIRQTLADGAVYAFEYDHYDGNNYGTLVTHPDGSQRRVQFNGGMYPASDTLAYGTPLAQTYRFERDGAGRTIARIDPDGGRTEYAYDGDGLPVRTTLHAGTSSAQESRFSHTSDGLLASATDPLGRTTSWDYANGCLSRTTDPEGRVATFTCTGGGQIESATTPQLTTSIFHYMGGDLVSYSDAMGRDIHLRYDALGREVAAENGAGHVSHTEYDASGRTVRNTAPDGAISELEYDANGNVTAALLPNQNGMIYEYDARDRRVRQTDAIGQDQYWEYDVMSRLIRFTDRRGHTTRYAYDALGRVKTQTYHDGSTVVSHYDAQGRLQSLVDSVSGTLSWEYDVSDQILSEASPQGRIEYRYDHFGRRVSMQANDQSLISYGYDAANRIDMIAQGSEVAGFAYDDQDRLLSSRLPNGVTTGYAYDTAGQLTGMAWKRDGGESLGTAGYAYDRVGKLVAQTGTLAPQQLPAARAQSGFDDNNRMLDYEGATLSYDPNGNLLGDGVRTFEWDARDRLVSIRAGGALIASFVYDALGRRISKMEAGTTTTYLYDGMDTVEERVGGSVVPVLPGLGVDSRISRGSGADRRYFLTDHLGSTRALLDEGGNPVDHYDYDPYGGRSSTAQGGGSPYQYTGRESDHSGLYYYRARYYHPGMGRFISEDPAGLEAGQNLYVYVEGNPLSYRDPDGHRSVPANSWNHAQQLLRGRGYTKSQMLTMYRRAQLERMGWNKQVLDTLSNLPDPYKNPNNPLVNCNFMGHCTIWIDDCTCPVPMECKQGQQTGPIPSQNPACICIKKNYILP